MAALIPPVFVAYFNCLQTFLIKDLTFCLCSYTSFSLSSCWCPLHHSLSSASLHPSWLSPLQSKGADTKSSQSGIFWWSFPVGGQEGWHDTVLWSGCDPNGGHTCGQQCVSVTGVLTPQLGSQVLWWLVLLASQVAVWNHICSVSLLSVWVNAERLCGKRSSHRKPVAVWGTELRSRVPTWSVNHKASSPH